MALLRLATPNDIPALKALDCTPFTLVESATEKTRDTRLETTFVAEDDGALIGAAVVVGTELRWLGVEPHHRDQGTGTELLQRVLNEGVDHVYVPMENRGVVHFYEQHGFRLVPTDNRTRDGVVLTRMDRAAEPPSQRGGGKARGVR